MAKKEIKNKKNKTSFTKSFKAELKKVIWPTPKQLFNNTVAVLVIVIITALIVFVLDFTFESMNKFGVDKVKQYVSNSSINETENEENKTEEINNQTQETEQLDESANTEETKSEE